jgi:hypothetical protein
MSRFMFPVLLVLLIVVLWVALRRLILRGQPRLDFNPANAPAPDWTSRVAESVVLACAAAVVLVLLATTWWGGGMLAHLDELRPALANVYIAAFAVTAAVCVAGVVTALLWRTWAGVVIVGLALLGYNTVLEGQGQLLIRMAPEGAVLPVNHFIIRVDDDVAGADVWVNDVPLGKTPIVMTIEEFLAKVPKWEKPPEGYDKPHTGPGPRQGPEWIRFRLPSYVARYDGMVAVWARPEEDYYAKAQCDGEWAVSTGSSGGGGGGGRYTHVYNLSLGATFPKRTERIERLVADARERGPAVGPEWFESMEAFRPQGWTMLRNAADKDPELMAVVDAWAARRYDLDKATSPETAWRAFERILAEADQRLAYATDSLAGRAVELLVPRLDPDRLVRRAEETLHSGIAHGNRGYNYGQAHGRGQFSTMADERYGKGGGLAPSVYAVAHAVWQLSESMGNRQPNLVQERLVPALLREAPSDDLATELAARLGGPQIERFLLRQNWRGTAPWPDANARYVFGRSVNKWLYYLAQLPSSTGRRFRQENAAAIMDMADTLVEVPSHGDNCGFLFLDLDMGKDSLAARYWPRFRAKAAAITSPEPLESCLKYLVRMGPAATTEMFVEVWRSTARGPGFPFGIGALDDLPPARRKEVAEALATQCEKELQTLGTSGSDEEKRSWLVYSVVPRLKRMAVGEEP